MLPGEVCNVFDDFNLWHLYRGGLLNVVVVIRRQLWGTHGITCFVSVCHGFSLTLSSAGPVLLHGYDMRRYLPSFFALARDEPSIKCEDVLLGELTDLFGLDPVAVKVELLTRDLAPELGGGGILI